jgi:hypothetical protein
MAESSKKAQGNDSFTPTEKYRRGKLLKQFTKLDGPKGTTQAYRDNYDRIFRKQKEQELTEPVADLCLPRANTRYCIVCQKEVEHPLGHHKAYELDG